MSGLLFGVLDSVPEYAEGGAEGFFRIIHPYHFRRADGFSLRQRPFADGNRGRGISAIRHCNRLNPIGISLAEVVAVESSTVRVRGRDVLDGTPLLDIKPCIRQFDRRDEVRSFSPEDLREYEGSS